MTESEQSQHLRERPASLLSDTVDALGQAVEACQAYRNLYVTGLRAPPTLDEIHTSLDVLRSIAATHLRQSRVGNLRGSALIGEIVAIEVYAGLLAMAKQKVIGMTARVSV